MAPKIIRSLKSIAGLVLLSACLSQQSDIGDTSGTSSSKPLQDSEYLLEDFGPAPQLAGTTWLNTDKQLTPPDLIGKVVLIDFWTFG